MSSLPEKQASVEWPVDRVLVFLNGSKDLNEANNKLPGIWYTTCGLRPA
jgi:hypothetical protein